MELLPNFLNPSSLPPLFSALLFAVLGVYVFLQKPSDPANRVYSFWCLLTVYWQTAWTILFNSEDPQVALLLVRIGYTGIVFLPVAYYHFIVNFLGLERRWKSIIPIVYAVGVFFALSVWIGNSFIDGYYRYSWGYYPRAGFPLHPIFLSLICIDALIGPWLIYQSIQVSPRNEVRRNQRKYVLFASIAYNFAAFDFLVNYGVPLYPLGVIAIIISNAFITYAILKYRLMDIGIFIRRIGLLMVVYLLLVLGMVPFLWLLNSWMMADPSKSLGLLIFGFIIMAIVVSLGPFLYAYFVRTSDYFHEHTMAGITHELKSPLSAIESALEVLYERRKVRPEDVEEGEYLQMIERNAERLRRFVDELLQVYKIQDKSSLLERKATDLRDLCESVAAEYKPLITAKGLRFDFYAQNGALLIPCDASKVRQALSNLLSNALKFTNAGSITLLLTEQDGRARVEVTDTGVGIPPEDLPRVFERFFQGEAGRRQKGTGIGLAVTRLWIEAHGGEIHVESEGPGRGSRFWVVLPKD